MISAPVFPPEMSVSTNDSYDWSRVLVIIRTVINCCWSLLIRGLRQASLTIQIGIATVIVDGFGGLFVWSTQEPTGCFVSLVAPVPIVIVCWSQDCPVVPVHCSPSLEVGSTSAGVNSVNNEKTRNDIPTNGISMTNANLTLGFMLLVYSNTLILSSFAICFACPYCIKLSPIKNTSFFRLFSFFSMEYSIKKDTLLSHDQHTLSASIRIPYHKAFEGKMIAQYLLSKWLFATKFCQYMDRSVFVEWYGQGSSKDHTGNWS